MSSKIYRVQRAVNWGTRCLSVAVILLLLASTAGLAAIYLQGKRLMSVQSQSMVPSFQKGDVLIVKPAKIQSLRPGDVISYQNPIDNQMIISHRLISINHQTGQLITAGDTLNTPDKPFASSLVVGRAVAVVPKAGHIMNGLRHPAGLALFIFLPAAIIIGREFKRLLYSLSTKHYQLPGYK